MGTPPDSRQHPRERIQSNRRSGKEKSNSAPESASCAPRRSHVFSRQPGSTGRSSTPNTEALILKRSRIFVAHRSRAASRHGARWRHAVYAGRPCPSNGGYRTGVQLMSLRNCQLYFRRAGIQLLPTVPMMRLAYSEPLCSPQILRAIHVAGPEL